MEWQCSDNKWHGPDRIGYKADFGTAMSAVVVKEKNNVRVSRHTSESLKYPSLKPCVMIRSEFITTGRVGFERLCMRMVGVVGACCLEAESCKNFANRDVRLG